MDIATGLGLLAGAIVLVTLIMMGGDLSMFADAHAAIVIFGLYLLNRKSPAKQALPQVNTDSESLEACSLAAAVLPEANTNRSKSGADLEIKTSPNPSYLIQCDSD